MILLSQHPNRGSPPHSWRILSTFFPKLQKARITSTLVENTTGDYIRQLLGEDHLHTRGEYDS